MSKSNHVDPCGEALGPAPPKRVSDPSFQKKTSASRWLGALRRTLLHRNLKSRSNRRRVEAADALAKVGDASSVPPLVEALSDEFYHVRLSAAKALAAIGDARAVPSMLSKLSDDGSAIGYAVLDLIERLEARQAIPQLVTLLEETDWRIREEECRRVHKGSNAGLGMTYRHVLSHKNGWRQCLVRVLGRLKAQDAVPALLPLLGERYTAPDWVNVDCCHFVEAARDLRTTTAQALSAIGDRRAVSPFIQLLDEDGDDFCEPYFSVINALAELGDQAAIRPLIRYWERSDYLTVYGPRILKALDVLTNGQPLQDAALRAKAESLTCETNAKIAAADQQVQALAASAVHDGKGLLRDYHEQARLLMPPPASTYPTKKAQRAPKPDGGCGG